MIKISQLDVVDDYITFREGEGLTPEQYDILQLPEIKNSLNDYTAYNCIDLAHDIISEGFNYMIEQNFDVGCIVVEKDEIIIKPDRIYIPTDLDDCERDCIIMLAEDEDKKRRTLPIKVYKFEKIEEIDGEEFSIYNRK